MWDAPQKDLLPLPVPHVDSAWWRVSLPSPACSNSELWRLRNCLHGLSALYSAHPARALAHRSATRHRISCAQRAVIQRVATRIRVYGDPPPDFEPEFCLRQLLFSKDLYSQEPQNLAPYCESKLRVLKGDSFPKEAVPLLPPQAGALLQNFRVSIGRPWDQVPDDLVLPKPYWDPVLAPQPGEASWTLQTSTFFTNCRSSFTEQGSGRAFLRLEERRMYQNGRRRATGQLAPTSSATSVFGLSQRHLGFGFVPGKS